MVAASVVVAVVPAAPAVVGIVVGIVVVVRPRRGMAADSCSLY